MKRSIIRWYIAKIKPRSENKIIKYLNQLEIENFQPLQPDGQPLLSGMLFVHTTLEHAMHLPEETGFAIDFQYDHLTQQLQTVPDRQMKDFIFLQRYADRLILLPEPEKLTGGEHVRVIGGEFAGIEGEIYRIKGHKRVVVRLGKGLAVAAESYIAKENIEKLGVKS
jgi:transcription antitermination factor NusG